MAFNKHSRGFKANPEINVTPLVDVMLVLLIIFMVTSPMLVTGVDVSLPETETGAIAGQDEPLVISINQRQQIFIGDAMVETNKLSSKLAAVLNEKPETRVFIRADRNLDYGKVMQLFAKVQVAGFKNIALITESN